MKHFIYHFTFISKSVGNSPTWNSYQDTLTWLCFAQDMRACCKFIQTTLSPKMCKTSAFMVWLELFYFNHYYCVFIGLCLELGKKYASCPQPAYRDWKGIFGIGKMKTVPGKRDLPKIGHGARDLFLHVSRECPKPSRPTGSSGQSESTRQALSGVSFQSKHPMECQVNRS